ncbi:hypothetical protein HYN59_03580 [Flavobacterium album]|uniref:Uncharacterized protein n=1 Tax=Flavobacterium album TaxID=2175091 RepID=A0A2S1QV05_9FLAO|nr:hypothetical protein [Flavobacterium album]AWH84248.1 hypothetical protein HYN59_03580 [Flavobacterium album]
MKEQISTVYLAFKFAILDHAYSKNEIIGIISYNSILMENYLDTFGENELDSLINLYAKGGDISVSSKIVLELLRKKTLETNPNYGQILKTLDTMPWLGGLDTSKEHEIAELIYFEEEIENFQMTEAVISRIKHCVNGYQEYDIERYLNNN